MSDKQTFAIKRTCAECPWRKDVPVGKFTPERYQELAQTCETGGLHNVFACHMTPEGQERACAGMMLSVGYDSNRVRMAVIYGHVDLGEIKSAAPLFETYREMAVANGVDADDPSLANLK